MAVTHTIITVSRQEGSGGQEIAQELAKTLKFTYVDSQIIKLATQHLGIPETELADYEGKVMPKIASLREVVTAPPDVYLSEVLSPNRDPLHLFNEKKLAVAASEKAASQDKAILQGYHTLVEQLIKDLAKNGNVVIVGRGANFILRGWKGVINVYIRAPLQNRVERYAYLNQVETDVAAEVIQKIDEQRAAFIKEYYGADWFNPDNYDLVINTARTPLPAATATIANYVKEVTHNQNVPTPLDIHRTYDRLRLQDSYNIKEAAELLLTNPDLLRQAVYRGELKATIVDHNVSRISREALVEWARKIRNN
jgi:cytidylate kinase